jgi:aspartate racemase
VSEDFACIGILGGMSPESTVTYYQTMVRRHHETFGDHSYPRIVIGSIPFQPINDACHEGDWAEVARLIQGEGEALARAGADFLLIAANTPHRVVPDLDLPLPLLPIYDAVADAARASGIVSLGLTGTRFTMTDGFYADALEERGLQVVLPAPDDMDEIHRIIYEELVSGVVRGESVERFSSIARRLFEAGAEAVLLGCTELELLTRDNPPGVPTLDTTTLHAEAAWRRAVGLPPGDAAAH